MWGGGPIFSVKSGPVPGFSGRSEYSVTPEGEVVPYPMIHQERKESG